MRRLSQTASTAVAALSLGGCTLTNNAWEAAAPLAKVSVVSIDRRDANQPRLRLETDHEGECDRWSLPLDADLAAPAALRVPTWEGRTLADLRSDPAARSLVPPDANVIRREASHSLQRLPFESDGKGSAGLRTRTFALPDGLVAVFYQPTDEPVAEEELPSRVVLLPAELPRRASRVVPSTALAVVATPFTVALDAVWVVLIGAPAGAYYMLIGEGDNFVYPWTAGPTGPEPLFPPSATTNDLR